MTIIRNVYIGQGGAVQPFAALTGYDAAVDETARYTEIREELTEDEVNRLNDDLNRLLDMLDERPEIRVTIFCSR